MSNMSKMHQLLYEVSPDPCKYEESLKFVSTSLVGVEVELEGLPGFKVNDAEFESYWNMVDDGSLRNGGREFVLARPFAGADLEKALNLFDEHVAHSGRDIDISDRTSVHVHIDIRELTFHQLTKFVCLYTIFEGALFNMVGSGRTNNIFSTSFANADARISKLGAFGDNPSADEMQHLLNYFTKYSSCNLAAVARYGSLEFRNHEGTYDIERITKWINILLLMKEAALTMEIPVKEIFTSISANGADMFFRSVFNEFSVDLEYPNLEYDMYTGIRLAQDIIYSQKLDCSRKVPKVKGFTSPFYKYYKKKNPERYASRIEEEEIEEQELGNGEPTFEWQGGIDLMERHHAVLREAGLLDDEQVEVEEEYE